MAAPIKTTPGDRVNVGGVTAIACASVVRPADTTQYAANEQVGSYNLKFEVARVDDGSGIINSAVLIDSTVETVKPSIDLLLFDLPVTNAADNAAVAVTDSEMERLLGVISFDGTSGANFKTGGANGAICVSSQNIQFVCRNGKFIYGVLAVRNTYTPVSGEKFTVRLGILQD